MLPYLFHFTIEHLNFSLRQKKKNGWHTIVFTHEHPYYKIYKILLPFQKYIKHVVADHIQNRPFKMYTIKLFTKYHIQIILLQVLLSPFLMPLSCIINWTSFPIMAKLVAIIASFLLHN
jgi:hypothetical protein